MLDLSQVEHALLRSNLFGLSTSLINVGRQLPPFPSTDPRSQLALRNAVPTLTFGLCPVTPTSPSLFIFKDPKLVHDHLHVLAACYLGDHIRVDIKNKTTVSDEGWARLLPT